MRLINKYVHETFKSTVDPVIFERTAARGIIMDNEDILMIYTKRYNDYSFPGGGVDEGEDIRNGLIRELEEETGAKNIEILSTFGDYEEFRPTHYKGYDAVHMLSHFFVCSAERELGDARPEDYEINNGSVPVWVNIHDAIAHNREVISAKEDSMGLSIERETLVLELVSKELL
ncbi:NUDIX domain-containing protein [Peptoclostridium litorale DSM 5388]|uniref:NUDIX hydrolase n=1 Tax=Peptoclostridium litorale DSM 5388 TaxID=1121324 RepID=A0A069REK5_PEPLI|nr:NUDIX domain-containing protein [Peptoclostridium litorale]KDR95476.1 NUDIX hydrolase [Peptoclostridium litorale DSM 5388]SIO17882.1 NUDIX domain-containing protein [Peptoclostridium litorale DSM 5388]